MKPSQERLHDALGELIYAVAKADGVVQASEKKKLRKMLQEHPWASEIQWSFDYEQSHKSTLEEAYEKALDTCKAYGPTEECADLFDILYQVASASNGLDSKEAKLIVQFKLELKAHFMDWKGD